MDYLYPLVVDIHMTLCCVRIIIYLNYNLITYNECF